MCKRCVMLHRRIAAEQALLTGADKMQCPCWLRLQGTNNSMRSDDENVSQVEPSAFCRPHLLKAGGHCTIDKAACTIGLNVFCQPQQEPLDVAISYKL